MTPGIADPSKVLQDSPESFPVAGCLEIPHGRSTKWLAEKVRIYRGSIGEIACRIPAFERRPFVSGASIACSSPPPSGNSYYDVVVRLPMKNEGEIPVGIVSKKYRLLPHRQLIESLAAALEQSGLSPDRIAAELTITEYATRMALRLLFPDRYVLDPGDSHPVALRLECYNSVDGRTRFQLHFGWFRFVCSNGLVLGSELSRISAIHNQTLDIESAFEIIRAGLGNAQRDVDQLRRWVNAPVREPEFVSWIDGPLKMKWGVAAAARAYHIATTAHDGTLRPTKGHLPPHERSLTKIRRVPGATHPAQNAYAVSQCLAWLAKDRNDFQEQIDRTKDIPGLMDQLLGDR